MHGIEFYSYILLFFSFCCIWIFHSTYIASLSLVSAVIIALNAEIISLLDVGLLIVVSLNLWLFIKATDYKFSLWVISILMIWLNFTNNLSTKLTIFDGLWVFSDSDINTFMADNFTKISIAILICMFVGRIIHSNEVFRLTLIKSARTIASALLSFIIIFYVSDHFVYSPYIPNFFGLWLFINFFAVSMAEETFFRLLIQQHLTNFSRKYQYGAVLSVFSSSLIYATSFNFDNILLFNLVLVKGFFLSLLYMRCQRIEITAILNTSISILSVFVFDYII